MFTFLNFFKSFSIGHESSYSDFDSESNSSDVKQIRLK